MGNTVILSVGEDHHLKRGKDHIIYAGMPSEEVYSIVKMKASGYQEYACSLLFPKKKQEIIIDKVNILV